VRGDPALLAIGDPTAEHLDWRIALMIRQPKRFRVVIAGAAVVFLAAAGCSSSANSAGSNPGGTGASGTSGTSGKDPIVLGVLSPEGGPFYNDPSAQATMKAVALSVNSAGGISGRDISIDWCNENDSPNNAQACARQFVGDKVVAVVDSDSVTDEAAVTQILSQAGIANVGWSALSAAGDTTKNIFLFASSDLDDAAAAVTIAGREHATKVVVVRPDAPTQQDVDPLIGTLGKPTGITTAPEILIPQTAADFSSYAKQIINSGAPVVSLDEIPQQAVSIIQDVHQLGGNPAFVLSGSGLSESLIGTMGSAGDNVYIWSAAPWIYPSTSPGVKSYVAGMTAAQKAGIPNSGLNSVVLWSPTYWAVGNAVVDVLKQLAAANKTISSSSFLTAFASAKNLETGGLTKPWSPSQAFTAVPNYQDLSNPYIYLMKNENSKPEPIDNPLVNISELAK
jgi:ABC-type branched-subunit amino acid transport system substrate-binding protein